MNEEGQGKGKEGTERREKGRVFEVTVAYEVGAPVTVLMYEEGLKGFYQAVGEWSAGEKDAARLYTFSTPSLDGRAVFSSLPARFVASVKAVEVFEDELRELLGAGEGGGEEPAKEAAEEGGSESGKEPSSARERESRGGGVEEKPVPGKPSLEPEEEEDVSVLPPELR